jgi:hypothetical protein
MITILGLSLKRFKLALIESAEYEAKNDVREYKTEKVHGYKARNLQKSHDERTLLLKKQHEQPDMPARRILHANYQTIKLPPIAVPNLPSIVVSDESRIVAKKRWRRLSIVNSFGNAVLNEAVESKKTELKPKSLKQHKPKAAPTVSTISTSFPQLARIERPLKSVSSQDSCLTGSQVSQIGSNTKLLSGLKTTPTTRRSLITRRPTVMLPRGFKLEEPTSTFKRNPRFTNANASNHPTLNAQLGECNAIVQRFTDKGMKINEKSVRRAILCPQEISHTITHKLHKQKGSKKVFIAYC